MVLAMNFLEHVFARGFVAFRTCSSFTDSLRASDAFQHVEGWLSKTVGPLTIIHDERLGAGAAHDAFSGVLIMGICVNPFDGSGTLPQLAMQLHDALKRSDLDFYDYLDQIGGDFVVVFNRGDDVRILQDCAATKTVYYANHPAAGVVAASHANLIAQPFGLPAEPRAALVYEDKSYREDPSRYLPGDVTPYTGLFALTSNNELHFTSGTTRRFFPREALPEYQGSMDELAEEIAVILKEQARLLAALGRPIIVATTGGRDSRVSVAAFSDYPDASLFSFFFATTGALSHDVATANVIARRLGQDLKVFNLDDYHDATFQFAFDTTSPRGIWPRATRCYLKEFDPEAIHVRSTVSEIGRLFYGKPAPSKISAEQLAHAYTRTPFFSDPLVTDSIARFMKMSNFAMDQFFNYNAFDMFYWEHRNAKWQNVLCMEAEMATDVFIPFNNRRLIKLFLSVPEKSRLEAELHVLATRLLNPALSDIPYV